MTSSDNHRAQGYIRSPCRQTDHDRSHPFFKMYLRQLLSKILTSNCIYSSVRNTCHTRHATWHKSLNAGKILLAGHNRSYPFFGETLPDITNVDLNCTINYTLWHMPFKACVIRYKSLVTCLIASITHTTDITKHYS